MISIKLLAVPFTCLLVSAIPSAALADVAPAGPDCGCRTVTAPSSELGAQSWLALGASALLLGRRRAQPRTTRSRP